jgi:hypothetical protein
MAFNPERLSLVVEPIGGVGLRWFNYQTDESEDDLITSDYLPDAEKYGLRAYDLIFVSPASGTEEPYILTVDAIDAAGNATLVNSARFGSDTLSYRDKAAVGLIRVPAATDNILISAYDATANPSAGRANYRAASDADYAATPALLRLTDAAGRKFIINEWRLNPAMAGGDPTGVADSTAAYNAIFDFIRSDAASGTTPSVFTKYIVEGWGGTHRIEGSVDATDITAWDFTIEGGAIIAACAGKIALDTTNSRGVTLSKFVMYGDEDNMPYVGICSARATTGVGSCDNILHDNITLAGFYELAADYCYASEVSMRVECRYFNYNPDGYCGIYEGDDNHPVTSDFLTIRTGEQSFLTGTYDTCSWQQVPVNTRFVITAIAKGATTTVTCGGGHTFTNGQTVTFWAVTGMVEINARAGTVSNVTATTFDVNINSTTYTNFTSGYAVRQASKPAIHFGGGRGHKFRNCYAAGYGQDLIEIDLTGANPTRDCLFDFLLEGAQSRSSYRFIAGTSARDLLDVKFTSDATHSRASVFSTDATGAGAVRMYGGEIAIMSNSNVSPDGTPPLFDDATNYGLYNGGRIFYPTRSQVDTANLISAKWGISAKDDGLTKYGSPVNGAWTPTVTSSTGTITTASATGNYIQMSDQLAFVQLTITVTTNGTGATSVRATLPSGIAGVNGFTTVITGYSNSGQQLLAGRVVGAGTQVIVTTDDGGYPATDGEILYMSGVIRVA